MKPWDALENLLGGYLNEDHVALYGGAWAAVDKFAQWEPDHAPQLRSDINELLNISPTDSAVERHLLDLGLGYLPSADGWASYRTWLLAVADRVDEILHKSPAA